jgi:hypothetical protein
MLRTPIRLGEIDPTGKSDEELEAEFLAYLRRASAPETEFQFVNDHTRTLLEARVPQGWPGRACLCSLRHVGGGARRTPVARRRSYYGADGGVRISILARPYFLGV